MSSSQGPSPASPEQGQLNSQKQRRCQEEIFIFLADLPAYVQSMGCNEAWKPIKDLLRSCIDGSPNDPAEVQVYWGLASCWLRNQSWAQARRAYKKLQNKSWNGSVLRAWLFKRTANRNMIPVEGQDDANILDYISSINSQIARGHTEQPSIQAPKAASIGATPRPFGVGDLGRLTCHWTATFDAYGYLAQGPVAIPVDVPQATYFQRDPMMYQYDVHPRHWSSRSSSMSTASSDLINPYYHNYVPPFQSRYPGSQISSSRSSSLSGSSGVSSASSQSSIEGGYAFNQSRPIKAHLEQVKMGIMIIFGDLDRSIGRLELRSFLKGDLGLHPREFEVLPGGRRRELTVLKVRFKSILLAKTILAKLPGRRLGGLPIETIDQSVENPQNGRQPSAPASQSSDHGRNGPFIIDGSVID